MQQIAAGVVYEATPEDLGKAIARAAVDDIQYLMDCLTHSPPEGVEIDALPETNRPLLELLAFVLCTYEVTLLPQVRSPEVRAVIRTSLRHQALFDVAISLRGATDQYFLSTGKTFLQDRLYEYYHILAGTTDHFALLGIEELRWVEDDWYLRTAALTNTALRKVCHLPRQPTFLESIGPTLHRYFQSMEELIPLQMRMITLKPSRGDVELSTAWE